MRRVLLSLPCAAILLLVLGMGATTPHVHVGSLYRSVQQLLLASKGATAAYTPGEVVPQPRDGHTVREGATEIADVYREMGVPPGCW